jgi:hypothetical protein
MNATCFGLYKAILRHVNTGTYTGRYNRNTVKTVKVKKGPLIEINLRRGPL